MTKIQITMWAIMRTHCGTAPARDEQFLSDSERTMSYTDLFQTRNHFLQKKRLADPECWHFSVSSNNKLSWIWIQEYGWSGNIWHYSSMSMTWKDVSKKCNGYKIYVLLFSTAKQAQYILWNDQQMQLYAVNFIPLLGSLYMFRVFYTPIIRSTIFNCIYRYS